MIQAVGAGERVEMEVGVGGTRGLRDGSSCALLRSASSPSMCLAMAEARAHVAALLKLRSPLMTTQFASGLAGRE